MQPKFPSTQAASKKTTCMLSEMMPPWYCDVKRHYSLYALDATMIKFSHAHLLELYIHMLLTGVNIADTISIPCVCWFSYPSPQIPSMDL